MSASNMFVLIGRTTKDIELKKTSNDTPFCNFTLAVDRPYRKNAERATDFIWLTAYGQTAEFLHSYVKKGTLIDVSGRIRVSPWEDPDGKPRSRTDLVVDDVEFVGPKGSGNSSHETEEAASAPVDPEVDASSDELPF